MKSITVAFSLSRSSKNYHIYEAPQNQPLIGKVYVAATELPTPAPLSVVITVSLPA